MKKKKWKRTSSKRSQGIPTPKAPQNSGVSDEHVMAKFKDYINAKETSKLNKPEPIKKLTWWQKLAGGGR